MAAEWQGVGQPDQNPMRFLFSLLFGDDYRGAAARYLIRYGRLPAAATRRLARAWGRRGWWMYVLAYFVYAPAFIAVPALLLSGQLTLAIALLIVAFVALLVPPLVRNTSGYRTEAAEWAAMDVLRIIVKHQLMSRNSDSSASGRQPVAICRARRTQLVVERRQLIRSLHRLRKLLVADVGPAELARDTGIVCSLLLWCARSPELRAHHAAQVCAALLRFLSPERDPYSMPPEVRLTGLDARVFAELPDPPEPRRMLSGGGSGHLLQVVAVAVPAVAAILAAVIQAS